MPRSCIDIIEHADTDTSRALPGETMACCLGTSGYVLPSQDSLRSVADSTIESPGLDIALDNLPGTEGSEDSVGFIAENVLINDACSHSRRSRVLRPLQRRIKSALEGLRGLIPPFLLDCALSTSRAFGSPLSTANSQSSLHPVGRTLEPLPRPYDVLWRPLRRTASLLSCRAVRPPDALCDFTPEDVFGPIVPVGSRDWPTRRCCEHDDDGTDDEEAASDRLIAGKFDPLAVPTPRERYPFLPESPTPGEQLAEHIFETSRISVMSDIGSYESISGYEGDISTAEELLLRQASAVHTVRSTNPSANSGQQFSGFRRRCTES
ncbi:hypothetical protein OBBRIDRAFT_834637 [Obba rivulosa]|uniref:Uncharacterized protein n=1 Tax=Obba rivulosa TaxID=1052685 RepID=A0A8E2AZF9_9APHY|nr:hypothetical protein OBBRIDRAFT_834637 [Obba rivulosa]